MRILTWQTFSTLNEAKTVTRGQAYGVIYELTDDSKSIEADRAFIIDQLSNNEASSDAELIDHFSKELQISKSKATKLVSVRQWFHSGADTRELLRVTKLTKSPADITKLAKQFAKLLSEEIGDDNMKAVVAANKKEKSSGVCHSHDYCDANMVMADAFKVLDIDLEKDYPDAVQNAQIVSIWNAAWDEAFKNNFWHK